MPPLPGEVVSNTDKQRFCQRTEGRSRFRAYEYALLTFRGGPLFPLMVEISLSDIDRALEELSVQFDQLLKEAAISVDSTENAEQFRRISTSMAELKERRTQVEKLHRENNQIYRRTQAAEAALTEAAPEITEWDEDVLYQLLDKVTVLNETRIKVTFRSGVEVE